MATQAAAGHPNLEKAKRRATQAATGHPNLAWAVSTAKGYPNLAKGRATQAMTGYLSLQKANAQQAANRLAKVDALRGLVDVRQFLA